MSEGAKIPLVDWNDVVTRAGAGDADAAMRVYVHYRFGCHDRTSGVYYLLVAYNLGNKSAIQWMSNDVYASNALASWSNIYGVGSSGFTNDAPRRSSQH